ncbi:IS630 family transposase ISDra3 [Deinococcus xinjiangensis]|uniref:IS630 family transposase ISDra3 n=1 Tax=Deinococcus xinjiangensis TaxID=457454 RepID=A0ABP9VDP8_9DEIO
MNFQPWKKKVEAGETIVWADEVGFSLKPTVGSTWTRVGHTPTIFPKNNWKKLSTIGGITSTGQFLQQTHEGAIKSAGVVAYLTHLLRHIPGKITVILDNAAIHKAKVVQTFLHENSRLSVVYLPPYTPEFNPVEQVWAYVKRHMLVNCCPGSLEELKKLLRSAWQKIRYRELPAKLLGLTKEFPT